MITNKAPMDEKRRLEVLRQYRVLDTPPEAALDDLVALAAMVCATPIALISLIDEHRQWFKSRIGLEATESSLDVSICVHALNQTDLLIVPDTTLDDRFARKPFAMGDAGMRFYAGAPLVAPGGEVLGTLCVMDRTPRHLDSAQEQALRVLGRQVMTHLELRRQARELAESERLLRTVFDSEPECVKLMGPTGALRMMNAAGLAMIEADSFEQVAGQNVCLLVATEQRAEFEALTERVFRGESGTIAFEIVGLKGTRRWMETHAVPLRDESGAITALLGISRDITERRRREEELRASEARYRTLFEYAPDGIIIADPDSRYIDANSSMCRMLGYSRSELIGLHASDIVAQSEVQHVASALHAIKAKSDYHREWKFRRKDGSVFFAEVMVTQMPDGNLLGMIRDITARQRAEERFRWLVDSNAQGVMFWNIKGETMGGNDAFLRLVGYSRADLEAGRIRWSEMTPPEYADLDRRAGEEIVAQGFCAPYEKEYIRKDGSRVFIMIGAATFEDNPEEGACFMLDLTERKKLEQNSLRTQRLDCIGTLASGIAHDLNNSLGPIIMSLDLLKVRFPDPASQELLAIIGSSAQRGADMVRQVLSFGRGVEGRRDEVRIRHLIEDVEKIANDTFLKHIQVRTTIPYDLWAVVGDPTQLHQVLLNLCVNARDAMPRGGTLTIRAQNRTLDAHYAVLNPEAKTGPYVVLQVADSGTGMTPKVMEKIFDPFFTTKEVGHGTGIGLSTSLAIVKSHAGFIRVDSEPGNGTTFTVYLPAQTEVSAQTAEMPRELPLGNGELILVVDDETAVREITGRALETFGYRVVLASDGATATAIFAQRSSEIAAVVTDMTMPILDGPTTINILRTLNPTVRIIAVSGLSSKEHVARAIQLGVNRFLPKPYTAEVLLKALREVLHNDRTAISPPHTTSSPQSRNGDLRPRIPTAT